MFWVVSLLTDMVRAHVGWAGPQRRHKLRGSLWVDSRGLRPLCHQVLRGNRHPLWCQLRPAEPERRKVGMSAASLWHWTVYTCKLRGQTVPPRTDYVSRAELLRVGSQCHLNQNHSLFHPDLPNAISMR